MALLTESEVRGAAGETLAKGFRSADSILKMEAATSVSRFDIFLSHSIRDAEFVFGVMRLLERRHVKVYVDWVYDRDLSRDRVTPATARRLRERMDQSKALFYVHSNHSTSSRWMPWELGYFDGSNGNVAILPIISAAQSFRREEYLGLYPYVDSTAETLWINRDVGDYKSFREWASAADKLRPR
jgi:TIR domain